MQVQDTSEINNPHLKILIYGEPGTGKTHFAGTAALQGKTLILSSERGLLSTRNILGKDGRPISIKYKNIDKFSDIEEAYAYLKNEKHDYKAVVLDSITEIQVRCMEHILEGEKRDKAQQADWGVLGTKMERMVRSFRDIDMSMVITALSEPETDQITGEQKVLPMLQGKFQRKLAGYFDEVFYSYSKMQQIDGKDKPSYYLLTRNSGKFLGKDRSGRLPPVLQDVTFPEIYELIYGKQPAPATTKEKT